MVRMLFLEEMNLNASNFQEIRLVADNLEMDEVTLMRYVRGEVAYLTPINEEKIASALGARSYEELEERVMRTHTIAKMQEKNSGNKAR